MPQLTASLPSFSLPAELRCYEAGETFQLSAWISAGRCSPGRGDVPFPRAGKQPSPQEQRLNQTSSAAVLIWLPRPPSVCFNFGQCSDAKLARVGEKRTLLWAVHGGDHGGVMAARRPQSLRSSAGFSCHPAAASLCLCRAMCIRAFLLLEPALPPLHSHVPHCLPSQRCCSSRGHGAAQEQCSAAGGFASLLLLCATPCTAARCLDWFFSFC